jgi:hypothetical protein
VDVIDELLVGDGVTVVDRGLGVGTGGEDVGVGTGGEELGVGTGGEELGVGTDKVVSETRADTIGLVVSSNPSRINHDLLSANEMKMTKTKNNIEEDLPIDVPRIRAI